MDKNVKEAIRAWNDFIRGFRQAANAWERFSDLVGFSGLKLDAFPLEVQRAMSRCNPKAKFSVALPRFADYVRSQGGTSEMVFEIEEEEDKPKEKVKPKTTVSNQRSL